MYKDLFGQVSERLNNIYKEVEAIIKDCESDKILTANYIFSKIVDERLKDMQAIEEDITEYHSLKDSLGLLNPIGDEIKALLNDLPAIFKDFLENEDKSEEKGKNKSLTADELRGKWEFFED